MYPRFQHQNYKKKHERWHYCCQKRSQRGSLDISRFDTKSILLLFFFLNTCQHIKFSKSIINRFSKIFVFLGPKMPYLTHFEQNEFSLKIEKVSFAHSLMLLMRYNSVKPYKCILEKTSILSQKMIYLPK